MKSLRHIFAVDRGFESVPLPRVGIYSVASAGRSAMASAPRERVVVLGGGLRYTEGEVARSSLSTEARSDVPPSMLIPLNAERGKARPPIDGALNLLP